MELIWTTEDFVVLRHAYAGFPVLLYDSMESCIEANQFMRYYLLRGAIGSRQSWPSTGRALYDFFSFLQAHELHWTDVQRGEGYGLVSAYRDYCLDTIGLSRATVKQRLLYVCKFYEYALRERWIPNLPFGYEERAVRRGAGILDHVGAPGRTALVPDVGLKSGRTLPKFLAMHEIQALIAAADNPHHRLMIRLALQTGLRREEIANFPVAYVSGLNRGPRSERNVRIRLDPSDGNGMKTKGANVRDILISRKLLADLHHYAVHVRGERASLSPASHPQLFLNQRGQPFAAHGKAIERIARNVGRRAGLQVHPHMLRHTYATHTLSAMQRRRSGIDPLLFIQRQLGHESIKTTMVYLHLVNERADDAILAYDDDLNGWAEAM